MYPNLKLQMWRMGLRQNRLALALGIDETALSRIMNGYRQPNQHLRTSIAEILESDEAWLFDTTQEESSNLHRRKSPAAP